MMNGIIIVNQALGHNEYKINRLVEESKPLDISLTTYVNDGSLAVIKNNKLLINLPKSDFVIYLDKDIYLAKALEKNGYRLFNKSSFIKLCDDKNLTNLECSNNNITMPKTMFGPLFYSPEIKDNNLTFIDTVIDNLKLPLVFKKVYGSLGTGVHLVESKEDLISLYRKNCREPLQFQEYIKTSYGRSIRVLVIGGKIIGAFERYNDSDFRSNYGDAASGKKFELNGEFKDFVNKISQLFNIEYAGIDLLFGENNKPILCEINSNAFFEEFEHITKINVAKAFLEMIKEKVKNEQK